MGDKFWMSFPRYSEEYNSGVCDFLNKAFTRAASGSEICCPCKKCCFRYWYRRNIIYDHLISDGFTPGYTNWCFHGDEISTRMNVDDMVETDETNQSANIDNLLNASFRNVVEDFGSMPEVVRDDHNVQAKKYFKLVSEGNDELYPGCKRFSKLSFTIRLYHLKCLYGISNAAFTDLLDLLKEAFPEAKLPKSSNAAKKVVKDLGLNYEKIHSCPNDCIIYWEKYSKADSCHICGESRWKKSEITKNNGKKKSVPAKIFRYFPLKCRLQRLFMCPKLANSMLWHFRDQVDDGILRHPADGQGWKDFDLRYPNFAKEPRNIRLGLATDGFNPFRTMSISHSTWPVILVIYNLPPWNCTKPEYLLLSSIIPGPSSPGKDIDIYLQPLIAELKELWEFGVETFDASTNQTFQLRASLLWTISDFPAYAMLRGWTTKGKFACPICHYETSSQYLKHSKKMCYMNHRKFLDMNHPWRRDKKSFNGHIELGKSPDPLSGTDVLDLLNKFENDFGKGRKKRKPSSDNPWRKRSIFFELSYWEFNSCCHNLDVMHIEKNICDNIIGTLLDIQGKTKDHLNARLDLQDMGIRRELHPIHVKQKSGHQQFLVAKSCFSMTVDEKYNFCSVLRDAKLPQGCASNISRCVDMNSKKITGYKSHDAHCIMHYLLQVAVKKSLPKHVAAALIRLASFFRSLCMKVVKPGDLENLQSEIAETLCQLEKIFPPSFFDIMVHLPIHLTNQIRLVGPVHCNWMYPVERYLCELKSDVRNRSQPEGSIAEAYLAKECLTFCTRYLESGMNTNSADCFPQRQSVCAAFITQGHPIGGRKNKTGKSFTMEISVLHQAHRYILFNCQDKEVEIYIEEHKKLTEARRKRTRWARAQAHSQEFSKWFEAAIDAKSDSVSSYILWLSKGPDIVAKRYVGYFINGYKFCTRKRDEGCKTQNSGVTLKALTPSFASSKDQNPVVENVNYYGAIKEIIEVNYMGNFNVVLFKCIWFQEEKDDFGLPKVNFNKLCYQEDPFVMANKVHQVFYIKDPTEEDNHYVLRYVPRDLFQLNTEQSDNTSSTYWGEEIVSSYNPSSDDNYVDKVNQILMTLNGTGWSVPVNKNTKKHCGIMQSSKYLHKKNEASNMRKVMELCPTGHMNTILKSKQHQLRQVKQNMFEGGKMQNVVKMTNASQVPQQSNTPCSSRTLEMATLQKGMQKNPLMRMQHGPSADVCFIERNQLQAKKNSAAVNEATIGQNQGFGYGTGIHPNMTHIGQKKSTLVDAGSVHSFLMLKQRKEQRLQPQQLETMVQLGETPLYEAGNRSNIAYESSDGVFDKDTANLFSNENTDSEPEPELEHEPDLEAEAEHVISSTSVKVTRGPTMMKDVQTRSLEQRKMIVLNERNQPVGPDPDTMKEFSSFLGTVARKTNLAPLNYVSWKSVPKKEQIWEFVNAKYIVPGEGKKWVLKAIRDSWRTYQHRVKQKYFVRYGTDQERRLNRPKNISEEVFNGLLGFWNLKDVQTQAEVNESNRQKQTDNHTAGPRSFARIYHEIKKDRGNDEPLSVADMYKATRKRKQGRVYKQSEHEVDRKMARIDELQAQGDDENMQSVAEITRDFIKPQSGRVCLYGRGVTPTDLQKDGMLQESTLKVPTECIKSIKISLEQEMQQQFAMEKALMDQKIEKLASEKAELEKFFEERLELHNASWQSKFSAMLQHLTQVSHSLRENNELIATLAAS